MRKFLSQINRRVHRLARKFNTKYKLNHMNRGVINFIDVGSVGGLPEPWDGNANLVKFCLNFEPNDAPTRSPNSLTYNTAVWEKDETRDFYNRGLDGTGSSLFKQNFKYVRENYEKLRKRGPVHLAETWFERSELVNTTMLKCRTIDDVLKEELPSIPFHFMKIDAQGETVCF